MRSALRALFIAYLAATALHVAWILVHEPFTFDAWNVAVTTKAKPFSVGNLIDFWSHEYTHSNPRIGQPLTYLSYKLAYFAPVASAIAMLAMALGMFVLGTGRWPKWREQSNRDLALVAIALGASWFVLPELGRTLFNRAYGANYFYGAVIQLWFLVPLRLAPDARASTGRCVAYALFGVVAGMANEHTGPTLCAFMLLYVWWLRRRDGGATKPTLAWAGTLGAIVGFAAIFFAPGQAERYDGLAQRLTLTGRLLQRGVTGNLEIFSGLVLAAAPVLALIVIVLIVGRRDADQTDARRGPLALLGVVLAASAAITMTLFVSPKLGTRFFILPTALMLAALIGFADVVLSSMRRLAPFVVLAVVASGYAAIHSIPVYARAARASEARLAALAASKPGSVFTAESFEQVQPSWWFPGDDLRDVKKREMIAEYFALSRVVFRTYDRDVPLGISDVQLTTRCEPAGAPCIDVDDWWEPGAYRGSDLAAVHKQLQRAIDRLRSTPAGQTVTRIEIEVSLAGVSPEQLPRARILLARWQPGATLVAATITRPGRSTEREVKLPPELTGRELYIYEVGGAATPLVGALRYTPKRNGVNWVLACETADCLVVGVTKIGR